MDDFYEKQDKIEENLRNIADILDECAEDDPEFFDELKGIFNETA